MKISKLIYNTLIKNGVRDVFMYSGGAIMPLINEFKKCNNDINYFISSNELFAGLSAVGYSKSTNGKRPGILITTSGPSITSSINSMIDANTDGTPLIVISGQVSTKSIGTNAFQEVPATDITKPITKQSILLDKKENVEKIIDDAFYLVNNGRKGSVHIDIPKDILTSEYDSAKTNTNTNTNTNISYDYYQYDYDIKYNNEVINKSKNIFKSLYVYPLVDTLLKSKYPVIIAGNGTQDKDTSNILNIFCYKYNIPIVTSLHGLGVVNENYPLALGMCGMHGHYTANKYIQKSDLIIAIGCRYDDRITCNITNFGKNANHIYYIGNKGSLVPHNIKSRDNYHSIISECKDIVKYIYDELHNVYKHKTIENKHIHNLVNKYNEEYVREICKKYLNNNNKLVENSDNNIHSKFCLNANRKYKPYIHITDPYNIKTQEFINEIDNQTLLRDDIIFTSGVGNHQMYMAQLLTFRRPGQFYSSGSLGDMNCGMSYPIGCQIANPDKTIVSIVGDGCFNMGIGELLTIKRYKLPIKIFVDNNKSLNMVKCWENIFYEGNNIATHLNNPKYKGIVQSYDIKYIEINNKKHLKSKIKQTLNCKKPVVCVINTIEDYCYPLVKPGDDIDSIVI
jgi:acetolactate synthase-1/2/3 large subunit